MSDTERLRNWMKENGHDVSSLAKSVGMSYDGVYQILYVREKVGSSFKWRFAQTFGWDEARSVFPEKQPA